MTKLAAVLPKHSMIILIMFLAAFLKLYHADVVIVNGDSDRMIFESLRITEKNELLLSGKEVASITGPFFSYLLLLPLLLYEDIHGVIVFFAILNIAAVYVCYRIGADFFSRAAGIIGALLFTVFPFSTFIFRGNLLNSHILPLFVSLFYYFLLLFVVKKKRIMVIPALFMLFLTTQIHSTLCFLPLFLIGFVVSKPGFRSSAILLMIVFAAFFFLVQQTNLFREMPREIDLSASWSAFDSQDKWQLTLWG